LIYYAQCAQAIIHQWLVPIGAVASAAKFKEQDVGYST